MALFALFLEQLTSKMGYFLFHAVPKTQKICRKFNDFSHFGTLEQHSPVTLKEE